MMTMMSLPNVGKRELRQYNLLLNDSKDAIHHSNSLQLTTIRAGLESFSIFCAKACEACMVPRDAFKQALWQT